MKKLVNENIMNRYLLQKDDIEGQVVMEERLTATPPPFTTTPTPTPTSSPTPTPTPTASVPLPPRDDIDSFKDTTLATGPAYFWDLTVGSSESVSLGSSPPISLYNVFYGYDSETDSYDYHTLDFDSYGINGCSNHGYLNFREVNEEEVVSYVETAQVFPEATSYTLQYRLFIDAGNPDLDSRNTFHLFGNDTFVVYTTVKYSEEDEDGNSYPIEFSFGADTYDGEVGEYYNFTLGPVVVNTWFTMFFLYDVESGTMKIYANGVLLHEGLQLYNHNNTLRVPFTSYFGDPENEDIAVIVLNRYDSVAIYDRLLTEGEMSTLDTASWYDPSTLPPPGVFPVDEDEDDGGDDDGDYSNDYPRVTPAAAPSSYALPTAEPLIHVDFSQHTMDDDNEYGSREYNVLVGETPIFRVWRDVVNIKNGGKPGNKMLVTSNASLVLGNVFTSQIGNGEDSVLYSEYTNYTLLGLYLLPHKSYTDELKSLIFMSGRVGFFVRSHGGEWVLYGVHSRFGSSPTEVIITDILDGRILHYAVSRERSGSNNIVKIYINKTLAMTLYEEDLYNETDGYFYDMFFDSTHKHHQDSGWGDMYLFDSVLSSEEIYAMGEDATSGTMVVPAPSPVLFRHYTGEPIEMLDGSQTKTAYTFGENDSIVLFAGRPSDSNDVILRHSYANRLTGLTEMSAEGKLVSELIGEEFQQEYIHTATVVEVSAFPSILEDSTSEILADPTYRLNSVLYDTLSLVNNTIDPNSVDEYFLLPEDGSLLLATNKFIFRINTTTSEITQISDLSLAGYDDDSIQKFVKNPFTGKYFIVTYTQIWTSTDAVSWNLIQTASENWTEILFSPTHTVVYSRFNHNHLGVSADDFATPCSIVNWPGHTIYYARKTIAYCETINKFVVFSGYLGEYLFITSTNATTWASSAVTSSEIPINSASDAPAYLFDHDGKMFYRFYFSGGSGYAATNTTIIMSSVDGLAWDRAGYMDLLDEVFDYVGNMEITKSAFGSELFLSAYKTFTISLGDTVPVPLDTDLLGTGTSRVFIRGENFQGFYGRYIRDYGKTPAYILIEDV